jgi:hypothetical protein
MTTRIFTLSAAVLVVLGCAAHARANQEMLASAKSLYESASYEAALSELSAINTAELVDTVDTYKALCLLGLGRVRDAEETLEELVTRKPLLTLSESEYSPRIVSLFRDVRRKALPAAAQQFYALARADYDNKKYEAAAAGFKQTLQIIGDLGPDGQTPTLVDLKELASGFLTLADSKMAATQPPPIQAPADAPSRAPSAAAAPAPVLPRTLPFFTLADIDVKPPVVIEQHLPPWTFTAYAPNRVFSGTLELLIDEKGAVENVVLTEPVWPPYDLALVQAAKGWSYQPALKAGKPVKFKRVLVINIDPATLRAR